MTEDDGTRPLSGLRVLELAHYIAGPYAAMMLGDLGAEIVKIEPPGGEAGRNSPPYSPGGESLYYASYNRNKLHLSLDLRQPDQVEVLACLIAECDAIVTNFSQGVPEKLGFGYSQVKEVNPRCVMVHITGCGSWSAYRDYVAFDGVAQAMSGVADLTGDPEGPPTISNVLFGDHVSAVQAVTAVLAGLQLRERTGEGRYVEVSMVRALTSLLGYHVPIVDVLGTDPHREGNRSPVRFMNVFPTRDGSLLLNPITPAMWRGMCEHMGRPDWANDESLTLVLDDADFRVEVEAAVGAWLRGLDTLDAEALLQSAGVACAGVRSVRTLVEEDRPKDLRLFRPVRFETGEDALVVGPLFEWGQTAPTSEDRISAVGSDHAYLDRPSFQEAVRRRRSDGRGGGRS
ncbi:MAG TPA: CoA transferase [Acidimicrobiales bacterium]|nr:CoA transferase [Acidimicrobiales bacterium]